MLAAVRRAELKRANDVRVNQVDRHLALERCASPGSSARGRRLVLLARLHFETDGLSGLIVKQRDRPWIEAGYQPEIAYFECLHELKLIVDLIYRGGLNYMRYSISDTAEYGDYTAGPRIVTQQTRETMRQLLREIKDGTFAKKWIKSKNERAEWFEGVREKEQQQQIEKVGEELRAMMTFLDPVTVKQTSKRTKIPA